MQLIINLPDREKTMANNRQRWAEVLADPRWRDCRDRIETNAFGNILMSPPPANKHFRRAFRIGMLLEQQLGGKAFAECAISTIDGVRACDAAWYSDERYALVRGQQASEIAPEICVEVASPSNTSAELRYKRDLYFEAGAVECWQCDLEGIMTYYQSSAPHTAQSESILCPNFPKEISY